MGHIARVHAARHHQHSLDDAGGAVHVEHQHLKHLITEHMTPDDRVPDA